MRTLPGQERSDHIENRLRSLRLAKGLSQGALAGIAGVTRQAVCAIETHQYLPTTAVALRLAHALDARVEDLFSLGSAGDLIEGELLGCAGRDRTDSSPVRVKIARVGKRVLVRPVASLGDVLNFTVPADGLLTPATRIPGGRGTGRNRVQVRLLRDRETVDGAIVVAGCDPAVFLIGEHVRRRLDRASVIGWTMGSAAAVEALKRGEVHVAGLHIVDPRSGESNVPYLRRHFKGWDVKVVTFAAWEQGFMVRQRNPKGIRGVGDLVRKGVSVVNREPGAGARLLLDQRLAASGIQSRSVRGYHRIAASHLEVARLIADGQADVGVGARSAAGLLGLGFIPIQGERYDLVIPTSLMEAHHNLSVFLDTLVSRTFRSEVEALGGYDTHETGRIVEWQTPVKPRGVRREG